MKHFNKLRDQIRDEQSELPDGFGWENMQDGIFEKMDGGRKSPLFLKYKLNKLLFLAIGFIVGVVFISFFFLQKEQNSTSKFSSNEDLNKKIEINNKSKIKTSTPKSLAEQNQSITNPKNKTYQTQSPSQESASSKSSDINKEQTFKNTLQNNVAASNQFDSKEISQNSNTTKKNESSRHQSNSTLPENPSINLNDRTNDETILKSNDLASIQESSVVLKRLNENEVSLPFSIQTEQVITTNQAIPNELINIESLSISNIKVESNKKVDINYENEISVHPQITPANHSLWSLELGGGLNTWSYGLENSQEENKLYSNTSGDLGFSFSSRLSRNINPKFRLTTGLDFDLMYKKLNGTYTRLDEREVKNALVSVSKNSLTGEREEVLRDTTVMDTIISTVNGYNKYQVVSIPLILQYNILKKSNWSIDVGFGPSFSFLTNYQGNYIDGDQLNSFDKSSNLYSTSPKIALNASLQIRKQFVSDYYFGFRFDFRNHLSNWAVDSENGMKPKVVNGSFVIGKMF